MSDTLLCGKVTEHDGEIVSVSLWGVAEFVPLGSPEHRQMVAATLERHEYERQAKRLRILPVEEVMPNATSDELHLRSVSNVFKNAVTGAHQAETSESKLVGRYWERARVWGYIVWAFLGFWLAVGFAVIWRGLAK